MNTINSVNEPEVVRLQSLLAATGMGGRLPSCDDPECGCQEPTFTEPMEALRFLSGRFKYAGVAHGVALMYARDIDAILSTRPAESVAQGGEVGIVSEESVQSAYCVADAYIDSKGGDVSTLDDGHWGEMLRLVLENDRKEFAP